MTHLLEKHNITLPDLEGYAPLQTARSGGRSNAVMVSWGPLMKR